MVSPLFVSPSVTRPTTEPRLRLRSSFRGWEEQPKVQETQQVRAVYDEPFNSIHRLLLFMRFSLHKEDIYIGYTVP